MGLSRGVETKQKQQKTSVHHPCLPLLAPEALWRAQVIPLGLTVARTSQGQQPRSMVRSGGLVQNTVSISCGG